MTILDVDFFTHYDLVGWHLVYIFLPEKLTKVGVTIAGTEEWKVDPFELNPRSTGLGFVSTAPVGFPPTFEFVYLSQPVACPTERRKVRQNCQRLLARWFSVQLMPSLLAERVDRVSAFEPAPPLNLGGPNVSHSNVSIRISWFHLYKLRLLTGLLT